MISHLAKYRLLSGQPEEAAEMLERLLSEPARSDSPLRAAETPRLRALQAEAREKAC